MAGPPVDHEALLLLLADWGLSSEVLRQVRERIPVVASPVKKPPPITKRLTAIKNKLNHLRMQHDRMVATYEREMEAARLTGVKITANEKEISDLDAEYRALAEQTRLTPTPTLVATRVVTPPGSDNGDDAAEGGAHRNHLVGRGYVVPRSREFGCKRVTPGLINCLGT